MTGLNRAGASLLACWVLWLGGCEEAGLGPPDGSPDLSQDRSRDATTDATRDAAELGAECPEDGVQVTEDITADTTWSCPRYRLMDQIFVTGDSTLTIAPGTKILGHRWGLVVTRGSQLDAVGTAAQPIVFTSSNAVGTRATGDWAGVALLGNATINAGTSTDGAIEGRLEGLPPTEGRALYGGSDDAGSCGHLEYVRIEFAGAEVNLGRESNALTLAGCGSGTRLSHIQIHRGFDDGIEVFGGTAGMDHVVISGVSDDSLDWDQGWRGDVQFLVIHQFPGVGDNGIEADNLGSDELGTPRSHPRLFNVTMVGGARGMVLREGTRGLLRNFIVQGFASEAIDLRATTNHLSAEWPTLLSIENSFFFNNGAYADESQPRCYSGVPCTPDGPPCPDNGSCYLPDDDNGFNEQAAIEDPARHNTVGVDPMLGSTSLTAPNFVPSNTALSGQATPPPGFDTSATYAGAFAPNGTDWTAGWTAYPQD